MEMEFHCVYLIAALFHRGAAEARYAVYVRQQCESET